ncbi:MULTISPECIES: Maf-like protein [Prevotellaceae]|uniref:Maf-like protein n=1 Tax=Prevotellaceae TaxID=171552 RepID=UPI0003D2C709|nr:Maf-like protein [Prevotella phocaeensis]ETD21734.1 septum formation protein Maf [Hoylesella oralis CC98A]
MEMKYKIILASNSPRRRELLAGLDIPFTVRVVEGIAESYPLNLPIPEIPLYIAKEKAAAYEIADDELVITADTVVVFDKKEVLGKPKDEEDARRMLGLLSGNTHQVITGVCLTTTERQSAFVVETDVTFKVLGKEEIDYYIGRYKPFDKAGAYGIQEWIGYVGVTSLHGSYFNVMGLPVQRIYEELKRMR